MKPLHTMMAVCTFAALPIAATAAECPSIHQAAATKIKAESKETKTINLKITGMT